MPEITPKSYPKNGAFVTISIPAVVDANLSGTPLIATFLIDGVEYYFKIYPVLT